MISSEIWSVQKDKFQFKQGNEKHIQIGTFTRKHLWWRPFKYNCRCEGLHLYEKVTTSLMLSCETCEVLQTIIFKKDWTVGRLLLICSDILDVSLVLSAINWLVVWGFQKQLFASDSVVSLKIFKDNQSILLIRSMQQRK